MLLVKNGYMIDPRSGMEGKYDILIKEGRIVQIAPDIQAPESCEILDAHGLLVHLAWWMSMCISGIPVFRKRRISIPARRQRQKEDSPQW